MAGSTYGASSCWLLLPLPLQRGSTYGRDWGRPGSRVAMHQSAVPQLANKTPVKYYEIKITRSKAKLEVGKGDDIGLEEKLNTAHTL
jgi:hypothetical protein